MIELNIRAKAVLLTQKLKYLRSLTLRLYQNDLTPTGADASGDFVEATFVGYAPQALTDFGPAFVNASGQGETDTCGHVFTQTVALPVNSIYGYYVTDPRGFVIFSERRGSPAKLMNSVGASYTVRIAFLEDTLR